MVLVRLDEARRAATLYNAMRITQASVTSVRSGGASSDINKQHYVRHMTETSLKSTTAIHSLLVQLHSNTQKSNASFIIKIHFVINVW